MASAISRDAIKLFAVQRVTFPGDTSVTRWQFQRTFPLYPPYITDVDGHLRFAQLNPAGKVKVIEKGRRFRDQPTVNASLAGFLRTYQLGGGYTPGPLFLFSVLAGLAGTIGVLAAGPPRAAGHRHRLPAHLPQRGGGPARVRPVGAELALSTAGPGHPAAGRGAGHHGGHRVCRGPAPARLPAGSRPGPPAGLRARQRQLFGVPPARAGPEPGGGDPHDQGQRDQHHEREQRGHVGRDDGGSARPYDQGDEDAEAALQALGLRPVTSPAITPVSVPVR